MMARQYHSLLGIKATRELLSLLRCHSLCRYSLCEYSLRGSLAEAGSWKLTLLPAASSALLAGF